MGPGESYHIAFATSFQTSLTTNRVVPPTPFDFGGIEAASWLTTLAAAQSGLLPTWNGQDILYRAVLSDSTGNAVDTTGVQGRVYNSAGQLLATDAADFFDGQLENPIGFDEFGNAINPGQGQAWSGVVDGGSVSGNTCGNWDLTAVIMGTDSANAASTSWLQGNALQCSSNSARLLGISPAITAPIPEPTTATLLLIATAGAATRRKRQHP
ncbi:MAG: PEP-CTERM sorting domain-containing protein [Planctomycetota bacterium]